ncbi:MAG: hypothetical protein ACYSYV_08665 [Planctomycetota bacterium]|jgi:hypothetical protein
MKSVIYMLAIAVLLIGGCHSSQESSFRVGYDFTGVDKVAIVAVEGTVRSETARDQIADFFAMELLEQGYAPVGRAQARALLKGQGSELTDLSATEGAVEAGLLINAPAVLAISIPHFGKQISIAAKMINVEDGSILWLASGSDKSGGTFSTFFGWAWAEGAGASGEGDDLLGGGTGGGLGGTTGQPLSPQEARKAQSIVKKMCKSLPSKVVADW